MARALHLFYKGKSYNFGIQKIDRKKLYGYTVIEVKDDNNSNCTLASISDDGKYILSRGCVGYITMNQQNEYVPSNSVKMMDNEGNELERIPSSFDLEKIELREASLEEYLQLHVKAVYQLSSSDEEIDISELVKLLKELKVLRFEFNYRTDYDDDDAFLIQNEGTIFMVTGQVSPFEFIGLEKIVESEIIEEEDDDDFDFGML